MAQLVISKAQGLNRNTLLHFQELPVSWDITQYTLSEKQTELSCLFHSFQVEEGQSLFSRVFLGTSTDVWHKTYICVFAGCQAEAWPFLDFSSAIHHTDGQAVSPSRAPLSV